MGSAVTSGRRSSDRREREALARTEGVAIGLDRVAYRYARTGPSVLTDVTLSVDAGTAVGLVGESGSGKSTLGRLIVGERRPTSGSLTVFGTSWDRAARRGPLRRAVQMVFQDPFAALNPYLTPLSAVAEAVHVVQGISRARAVEAAEAVLRDVGLEGPVIERTPASLSGGQRQRVVIARSLACEPRIIVADEPTSALDISVQAQILNLLLRLQEERGLTLVLISHDIAVVRHLTDQVAVLDKGRIVETGDTERVLSSPQHPYTQRLVDAYEPRIDERS